MTNFVTRATRILLVLSVTYPLWGLAFTLITGYWPPHWMEPWADRSRPEPCMFCGGGAPG